MKYNEMVKRELHYRRFFLKRGFQGICTLGIVGTGFGVIRFFQSEPNREYQNDFLKGAFHPDSRSENFVKKKSSEIKTIDGWYELPKQKLSTNHFITLALGGLPVIIISNSGHYKTFNSTCTHLGCLVKWDPAIKNFICPCHAGRYNIKGEPISGPPPYPLKEYETIVKNDKIRIHVT